MHLGQTRIRHLPNPTSKPHSLRSSTFCQPLCWWHHCSYPRHATTPAPPRPTLGHPTSPPTVACPTATAPMRRGLSRFHTPQQNHTRQLVPPHLCSCPCCHTPSPTSLCPSCCATPLLLHPAVSLCCLPARSRSHHRCLRAPVLDPSTYHCANEPTVTISPPCTWPQLITLCCTSAPHSAHSTALHHCTCSHCATPCYSAAPIHSCPH